MNITYLFIAFMAFAVVIALLLLWRRKMDNDHHIELKCRFFVSDQSDSLLDTYQEKVSVELSGVIGNDFMTRYGYVIDYENMKVMHKSVEIDIKTAIEILELPLIALYQNGRKYIFLLDTGSTDSVIHSRYIDGMEHNDIEGVAAEVHSLGGATEMSRLVETSLFYKI